MISSYFCEWEKNSILPCQLQHFALKPKPRRILKALLSNAFKILLVVLLIGNCYKFAVMEDWQ
jgi:hypothetical protein